MLKIRKFYFFILFLGLVITSGKAFGAAFDDGSYQVSSGEVSSDTKQNNMLTALKSSINNITSAQITDGTIANADIASSTIDLTAKVTGVLPAANAAASVGTVGATEIVTADSNKDTTGQRNITITGSYIIGSASMAEADLEQIDDLTAGTVTASKALVVDASKDLGDLGDLTFDTSKGFILPSSAQGDIAYFDGTRYVRLAPGTSGKFLQTQGAGANPQWASTAMQLIDTQTASNSASIEFTSFVDSSAYQAYMVVGNSIVPDSNSDLWLLTSTNGGVSYDSAADSYDYAATGLNGGGTSRNFYSTGDTQIILIENTIDSGPQGNIVLKFFAPENTTNIKTFLWQAVSRDSASEYQIINGAGARKDTADIDAIQFKLSSGNITSGVFYLYGIRK